MQDPLGPTFTVILHPAQVENRFGKLFAAQGSVCLAGSSKASRLASKASRDYHYMPAAERGQSALRTS